MVQRRNHSSPSDHTTTIRTYCPASITVFRAGCHLIAHRSRSMDVGSTTALSICLHDVIPVINLAVNVYRLHGKRCFRSVIIRHKTLVQPDFYVHGGKRSRRNIDWLASIRKIFIVPDTNGQSCNNSCAVSLHISRSGNGDFRTVTTLVHRACSQEAIGQFHVLQFPTGSSVQVDHHCQGVDLLNLVRLYFQPKHRAQLHFPIRRIGRTSLYCNSGDTRIGCHCKFPGHIVTVSVYIFNHKCDTMHTVCQRHLFHCHRSGRRAGKASGNLVAVNVGFRGSCIQRRSVGSLCGKRNTIAANCLSRDSHILGARIRHTDIIKYRIIPIDGRINILNGNIIDIEFLISGNRLMFVPVIAIGVLNRPRNQAIVLCAAVERECRNGITAIIIAIHYFRRHSNILPAGMSRFRSRISIFIHGRNRFHTGRAFQLPHRISNLAILRNIEPQANRFGTGQVNISKCLAIGRIRRIARHSTQRRAGIRAIQRDQRIRFIGIKSKLECIAAAVHFTVCSVNNTVGQFQLGCIRLHR